MLGGRAPTLHGAGFTLVEALVALVLSSVIVVLVSTVFLVQNNFFSRQVAKTAAQDNARSVTEYIASDVRSAMPGGVVVAGHHDLVVHSPMVLAAVCGTPKGATAVYIDGGTAALDTAEISGFAMRNDATGSWTYYDVPGWGTIWDTGGHPPDDCAHNDADTTGAYGSFVRLKGLATYVGYNPQKGTLLMLYRNVEFTFQQSEMDSTTWGLFRGIYGDTPDEFATGMDTTSGFWYRTGGSSYASSVTGASLSSIDAIRIKVKARERAVTGGQSDITYGWSVNVILRNAG